MTKEEREKAISKIKDIQDDLGCFCLTGKFYNDEEAARIDALNLAVEVLSEESKLDKIVAEIENIPWTFKNITSDGIEYDIRKSAVINIINKYRRKEK